MKNTARDIIVIVASLVAILVNILNINAGATGTGFFISAFVILMFLIVIAVTLIRKYKEMN
jgi:cytochrome c biogenesis factor